MSIAAVQKIQVCILKEKAAPVLAALRKAEILEPANKSESAAGLNEVSVRLEKALLFLNGLFPEEKNIFENFITVRPILARNEYEKTIKDVKSLKLGLGRVEALQSEYLENVGAVRQTLAEIERYRLYRWFEVDWSKLNKVRNLKFIFGTMSLKKYLLMQRRPLPLQELEFLYFGQDEKTVYCGFAYFAEQESALKSALNSLGFSEVILPELKKITYAQKLAELKTALTKLEQETKAAQEALHAVYKKEKIRLLTWGEYFHDHADLQKLTVDLPATEKVIILDAWIESSRLKELERILNAKYTSWEPIAPAEKEQPPTILKNNILAPFESVSTVYGLPNINEFDPTPLLSIFFIVFYGLCLSDAGYGLMLFFFTKWLLKKYAKHLTAYGKKLLILNSWCGISTMIVGVLTGGYFGLTLTSIPVPAVSSFLLKLRLTDTMSNPLPMLILSLLLGVFQIYIGMLIRFFLDFKQRGLKEAVLTTGVWLYFIAALIGLAASSLIAIGPKAYYQWAVWSGVVILILTQGRHHKNWLMRLGSGVISLYKLSGFTGDVLSYSRLFALGLVTSVLSMVINLLAFMAASVPILGIPLMLLVLVFGHIFDFLINILGSFVHSARLQYLEYFSKFFEGGGRQFKPLALKPKYIKIED